MRVVGAEGRVDVCGEGGLVTLVWDGTAEQAGWQVVLQRIPTRKTATLNANSLKFALEQVMLPIPSWLSSKRARSRISLLYGLGSRFSVTLIESVKAARV
jgi:hypothetical protein